MPTSTSPERRARTSEAPAETGRFVRLGQILVRRRRPVVVLTVILFVISAALGADVASKLSGGGFENPGAQSSQARELLEDRFGAGEPNVVVLVRAEEGTVDDPAVAAAGRAVSDRLAVADGMTDVVSYWSLGAAPPLRAGDGSSALVLGRLAGTEDEIDARVKVLTDELSTDGSAVDGTVGGVVSVSVGGRDATFAEVGETIEGDLATAELIAFPITLLLLVLVFRSIVAAALPLAVGALAIVGTFLVLELLAGITTVSIFALNLTTALGLGLAIDYSLFVVSRYREERARGHGTHDAIVRTVATAGRAVFVSGLTVAVSLSALLVFPIAFLRSFAYAGIPVVALAVLGAVGFLPAAMASLGDRIDKLSLPQRRRLLVEGSFWYRAAHRVMRRPWPIAAGVVALLLLLGVPFLHISFGLPDDRVLPPTAEVRQVSDTIRDDYGSDESGAASVVLPDANPASTADIGAYAADLSTVAGVARVDAAAGIYVGGRQVSADAPLVDRYEPDQGAGTWLSVVPSVEPVSSEGEELVRRLREVAPPAALGDSVVGGPSAELVDVKAGIFERLPLALLIVAGATFVLLFLMFGSILVPVKALVLNTLSLTATFGAMVWIFQDGNLSSLLDFTATGMLDTTIPVLMFCIAFGLSMDYEVFLLSRIREEYDRTGDDRESVAVGLARTGRIITAASVLIAVVFLAFASSSVSFIKLFGIGLTLAVLMDATVIRGTLVPAFMAMAGRANWWAPAWMTRIADRVGLGESAAERDLESIGTVGATASVEGAEPVPAGGPREG
jgi:RND superfamily putative drug exporter